MFIIIIPQVQRGGQEAACLYQGMHHEMLKEVTYMFRAPMTDLVAGMDSKLGTITILYRQV